MESFLGVGKLHRVGSSVAGLVGEVFDGAEFLVDFGEGGGAALWLAWAGRRGLAAQVLQVGEQGVAAHAAGGEGDDDGL